LFLGAGEAMGNWALSLSRNRSLNLRLVEA
jgi:hypothetical protein